MSDHEERIEKLEIDLAHALRTIEDLNEVVVDQDKTLRILKRKFTEMTDQVEELIENALPGHQVDKPPHY